MKIYKALGYIGTLAVGLTIGYFAKEIPKVKDTDVNIKRAFCLEEKQRILSEMRRESAHIESRVYSNEGFYFSPGGGYWFYPEGSKLTQIQKDEISRRINTRLEAMNDLTETIYSLEK